ncbi:MAG: translocation/assembly module TamB domain-containing protein, partial [Acidobacteriaceae bacterium]|nr:translocation/assembly module TamB domain-containing protein [Acidobacteriaceae bacterium]
VEESTGGKVDIGSFQVDLRHLTIFIRDFVLHGTEPKTEAPLARIKVIELHLRLFSGIAHMIKLAYIGIQQPNVNLIAFPDGRTNIPEPKNPKKSTGGNPLQTVVDLKIGQFNLQDGLLAYRDQKDAFSGRGENLHILLNYNTINPSYQGNVSFDPLALKSDGRAPLVWHVNVPLTIEKDAIRVSNATLATDRSKILLNVSMEHMNAPVIDATLNAGVALPEIQRSLEVPIDSTVAGAPKELSAELNLHMDDSNKTILVKTAHIGLGETTLQASGTLRDVNNPKGAVQFNANLALGQVEKLLKVTSPEASGAILVNGFARLDAQNNYKVDGTINSRDLSVRSGTTRVPDVKLYTPFHADPYLVSLDGLKLNALGGSLAAKVFIEKMQQLSVEGTLHNFSVPVLAAVATGKRLGYDGTIDGSLKAEGNLKAKGTSGYAAQVRLAIVPGHRGVPISGRLNADYRGATDVVDVENSYVQLPHSRLDLSGALNRRLDINLVSHNLNDFLPAANFGAKQPETSLPITLQGGTASIQAQVTGNLAAPRIQGHVAVNRFAVEQRTFDQLALDVAASPSAASVQNGLLTKNALRTTFDASLGLRKWSPVPRSPVSANLSMRNASVSDLLALAGESSIPATGDMTADVHVNGTYGDPTGTATIQVANGTAYDQPFNRVYAQVNLADQLVTLSPLEVVTNAGTVNVAATYRHPRDTFMVGDAQVHVTTPSPLQLGKLRPLQEKSPGADGIVRFTADAAASIREVNKESTVDVSNIAANVSARGLRVQNQNAGDLTLTATTQNKTVQYQLASNFAGSNININGRTTLAPDYPTTADAAIQNLSVSKVLSIAGQGTLPASGDLSANAHVAGTVKAPNADLTFALTHANVYQEAINRLAGTVHYTNTLIAIPSVQLDVPAGTVNLSGSLTHPQNDFNAGSVTLTLNSSDISLAKIQHVHEAQPTLKGTVHLAADLAANLRERNGERSVLFSHLNADVATKALELQQRPLGQAVLAAHTTGSNLDLRFDSDIAQSSIHLVGQSQLAGDYPTRANLTFANIRYSNLAPFLSPGPAAPLPFDALVEGRASVNGPALDTNQLQARLELTTLNVRTNPAASPTGVSQGRAVTIENEGPVVVDYDRNVADVKQFKLRGPGTSINISGSVNLKNESAPINLHADANLDLALLEDIDPDFNSRGNISMNAAIHGSFAQPLVNGRIELHNANVNYATAPNGLSNGNGVILLTGTGAVIQNLTGESGGGKITVTGFAGLTGRALTYDVKATANHVRVRYSGISVTSNATITVVGNSNRSLVSGNVSIQRIAYNSASDAGSILSNFASTPPSTPSAPSLFLTGMRLNIHIVTAPDLQVVTTYANRLAVEANLTVRGTAAEPGVLGSATVTDGQLVFFGNTYTVNTGTVNFYSPTSIEPVVNFSLQTLAQGVDVTLGVSGPVNNLQLSYRSDPPLTFEQIVQLLATNTTPADPNIVANQPPTPQQSFTQMGESAILGQAVANPLASRVQRVFGLSQFKIDPSVAGSNGQPTARVTLQEKIANNITFTYITDVTQSNSEIVRVQWDLTPRFSA